MKQVHGYESNQSLKRKSTEDERGNLESERKKSKLITTNDKDKARAALLLFTKCTIVMSWPFSWTENATFRDMLLDLDGYRRFGSFRVRRAIMELYFYVTDQIKKDLHEAKKESCGLPMFHVNVDLWVDTISGQKFIGVRIFYLNKFFEYKSRLLAVKLYKPHPDLKDKKSAGELLCIWIEDVLCEFGLNIEDVRSATTDGGSDVKKCFSTFMCDHWIWCIPHLINRALVDALGMNEKKKKKKKKEEDSDDLLSEEAATVGICRNKEMRTLLADYKNALAFTKQSGLAKDIVDHLQYEECAAALRVTSYVPHRWSSLVLSLERFLKLRNSIRSAFRICKKTFPLNDSQIAQLIELYSVLVVVKEVVCTAQGSLNLGSLVMTISSLHGLKSLFQIVPEDALDAAFTVI